MEVDHRFIIRRLMDLEKLYVLHSRSTHEPFVEYSEENLGDQVYLFDKKEEAEALSKVYEARHYGTGVAEVLKAHFTGFYSSLLLIGIDTLVFRNNGEDQVLRLNEIVKMEEKEPDEKEPPRINANLQLTVIYYLQERRRIQMPAPDQERKERLDELEEEMWANVARSRFIMPMIPDPGVKDEKGRQRAKVYLIKTREGAALQPIFSDLWECQKFFKGQKKKIPLAVIPFEGLKHGLTSEAVGYILNPTSTALPIMKTQLV